MTDLRDRCCYKRCRDESDLIFMGAGLCDTHYELSCSTIKTTYAFLLPRVVPAAVRALERAKKNHDASRKKTTPI